MQPVYDAILNVFAPIDLPRGRRGRRDGGYRLQVDERKCVERASKAKIARSPERLT